MAKKKNVDIEDFRGITADVNLNEIIEANAKIAVNKLKEASPKSKKKKKRNQKRYRSQWKYKFYPEANMAIVYNKKANLTYLLEHGHVIATKKYGAGWAAPQPHIEPVFETLPESITKIVWQTDIDFDIY